MKFVKDIVERYGQTPYTLYELTSDGVVYRFTPARHDITMLRHVWSASAASHSRIENTSNPKKGDFTITFPINDPFASQLLGRQYVIDTKIRVFGGFDLRRPTVKYVGSMSQVSTDEGKIHLTFDNQMSGLDRKFSDLVFSQQCPHVLYGPRCGVSRSAFTVVAAVDAVDRAKLTVPYAATKPAGYYSMGIVKFGEQQRWITHHSGSELLLDFDFEDLEPSDTVELSAGCSKGLNVCHDRFDNTDRNGSFPNINKNPVGGL